MDRDDQTNAKLVMIQSAGARIANHGCSKARQVRIEPITNKHNPKLVDQIETTSCPGLEIKHYIAYVHKPPARIPDSLVLTDPKRKLPFGLKLGSSRSTVEKILGVPDGRTSNSIYYLAQVGEAGGEDAITFIFDQERTTKVVWSFFYE